MIHVAVVDDNEVTLDGLKTVFRINDYFEDMKLVYTSTSPVQMMEFLNQKNKVDVLLVDVRMIGIDGIQFLKVMKAFSSDVKSLMYSSYDDTAIIESALTEGASGYLNKNCDYEELHKAIMQVHEKGFYLYPQLPQGFVERMTPQRS